MKKHIKAMVVAAVVMAVTSSASFACSIPVTPCSKSNDCHKVCKSPEKEPCHKGDGDNDKDDKVSCFKFIPCFKYFTCSK